MLDLIRNNRKAMLILLVVLVFPSFVFLGITRFGGGAAAGDTVAEIDGAPIAVAQLEQRIRVIQQNNEEIDPALLSQPEVKLEILVQMVRDTLWRTAAVDHRLVISDSALRQALKLNPFLQSITGANGKVDMQAYEIMLRRAGVTYEEFEESERVRVMSERMQTPVAFGFTSQIDIDQQLRHWGQKYVFRQRVFNAGEFMNDVEVTLEELKAYYQANLGMFTDPAFVDIEYIVFDEAAYTRSLVVSEEEARAYFEQNRNHFAPHQYRASHILVEVAPNANQNEKEQARARAEQILEEVRQDSSRFAEIAKANSDDYFSATQGGDLGYFTTDVMEPEFARAISALSPNDISGLVETRFGYHIIMLTDSKIPEKAAFEDFRAKVEEAIREQMAVNGFVKAAEGFASEVNAPGSSLEAIAQTYGLEIQQARNVTPSVDANAYGALANTDFRAALFAPSARESGQNVEAIPVGPMEIASARVLQYRPETVRPFEAVEQQIRIIVSAERAVTIAQQAAENELKVWQESVDQSAQAQELAISLLGYIQGQFRGVVSDFVAQKVFSFTAQADFPQAFVVQIPGAGAVLVQIERIEPANMEALASVRSQMALTATSLNVNAQANAYMNYLQEAFKVKFYPEVLSAGQGQSAP